MEVRHGVAAVGADVEHEAVAPLGQPLAGRHLLGQDVHRRQVGTVVDRQLMGVVDVLPRDDQHVGGHRRAEVAEGVRQVALGHPLARDVAGQDLAEQAVVGHAGDGSLRPMPDEFALQLHRLVADAAATEAARQRSQERVLRETAASEATFAGVVLDLAERGVAVVVRTAAGRLHRGRVIGVGTGALALRDEGRPPVVVAMAAVTSVRPQAGEGRTADAAGGRPAPLDLSMTELLVGLAEERPRVQVACPGEEPFAGELRSVGLDVVTVQLDGDRRLLAHVPIAAITDVVLLDR